jgi:acyl-CoA thioesterase
MLADQEKRIRAEYERTPMTKPTDIESAKELIREAYDFGQFADDFEQPQAKPVRAAIRILAAELQRQREREGEAVWVPLSDVQWMNIVNHEHAWLYQSKEEAIHEAVKMTEAKCRENNSTPQPTSHRELLEKAALEAEHWQKIGKPEHKCGEYIAAAIRALISSEQEKP